MKTIVIAAAIAVGLVSAAHAEGTDCQANILGGGTIIKDASGAMIAPFPYARPGEAAGGDYAFTLAGGDGSYTGGGIVTPAVNLEGTSWVLATLNGQPAQSNTTLMFEPGGRMGGDAPCNRYFGSFAQGAGVALTFSQIGATRRACPALSEEGAYFQALEQTTEFRIGREGDFLALFGPYERELATFASASGPGPGVPGVDLVGSWGVTGVLIDGSVQAGSELASVGFTFGADGRFNAGLGCNNAFGDYASDGQKLSFGTVGVTRRQCFAPAPFEGPILTLLPLVRWVQSTGSGVAFQDDTRQTLITLTR